MPQTRKQRGSTKTPKHRLYDTYLKSLVALEKKLHTLCERLWQDALMELPKYIITTGPDEVRTWEKFNLNYYAIIKHSEKCVSNFPDYIKKFLNDSVFTYIPITSNNRDEFNTWKLHYATPAIKYTKLLYILKSLIVFYKLDKKLTKKYNKGILYKTRANELKRHVDEYNMYISDIKNHIETNKKNLLFYDDSDNILENINPDHFTGPSSIPSIPIRQGTDAARFINERNMELQNKYGLAQSDYSPTTEKGAPTWDFSSPADRSPVSPMPQNTATPLKFTDDFLKVDSIIDDGPSKDAFKLKVKGLSFNDPARRSSTRRVPSKLPKLGSGYHH